MRWTAFTRRSVGEMDICASLPRVVRIADLPKAAVETRWLCFEVKCPSGYPWAMGWVAARECPRNARAEVRRGIAGLL